MWESKLFVYFRFEMRSKKINKQFKWDCNVCIILFCQKLRKISCSIATITIASQVLFSLGVRSSSLIIEAIYKHQARSLGRRTFVLSWRKLSLPHFTCLSRYHFPTKSFTTLEAQDPEICEFYLYCSWTSSTDFESPKAWKGLSGWLAGTFLWLLFSVLAYTFLRQHRLSYRQTWQTDRQTDNQTAVALIARAQNIATAVAAAVAYAVVILSISDVITFAERKPPCCQHERPTYFWRQKIKTGWNSKQCSRVCVCGKQTASITLSIFE